jgi:hypothetical protein
MGQEASAMNWSVEALGSVEREAWRQLAEAAPPDFARGIGLVCEPLGGALFLVASRIPTFQFNWRGAAPRRSSAGLRAISK